MSVGDRGMAKSFRTFLIGLRVPVICHSRMKNSERRSFPIPSPKEKGLIDRFSPVASLSTVP